MAQRGVHWLEHKKPDKIHVYTPGRGPGYILTGHSVSNYLNSPLIVETLKVHNIKIMNASNHVPHDRRPLKITFCTSTCTRERNALCIGKYDRQHVASSVYMGLRNIMRAACLSVQLSVLWLFLLRTYTPTRAMMSLVPKRSCCLLWEKVRRWVDFRKVARFLRGIVEPLR